MSFILISSLGISPVILRLAPCCQAHTRRTVQNGTFCNSFATDFVLLSTPHHQKKQLIQNAECVIARLIENDEL